MSNSKIRQVLQKAIDQKRQKMEDEDFSKFSESIAKELGEMVAPEKVTSGIVDALTAKLAPIIQTLLERDRASAADIESVISKIQLPDVQVPEIRVPEIRVPKVNVPAPIVNMPPVVMPDQMDITGWVNMMLNDEPVSLGNPLPVTLRDADGAPMDILGQLSTVVGGGGGKHDYFTIKGFSQSAYSELTNADGRLRVSVETGGSGLTDLELRASALEVVQVSGAISSTNIKQLGGTDIAVNAGEVNAGTLRVAQATDVVASVNIVSGSSSGTEYADGATAEPATGTVAMGDTGEETGNIFALRTASGAADSTVLRVVHATDVGMSVSVTNSITSTGAYLLDGDGNYRDEIQVSGITASTASALVDSTGVQYSGSNPLSVTATVSGSVTSTVAVGDTVADAADSGSAPVKQGGIARTTNPTAVANGDRVSATYDDVGRQIVQPYCIRDLRATAYTSLSNGTETSLLAGVSSEYHDLVWVMGANQSDAAVTVDLRGSTGGGVIMSLEIPANATAGIAPAVPYPQADQDASWTVDMPDITGTTVDITALFSKE